MADQRNQADDPDAWIPDDEWETIVANVPLVSVDLVIRHEGGVVLGLRENDPARGEWFVPGGTVFKNETLTDAVHRVADKELGVDVTIQSRLGTFEHFYDTSEVDGVDSKHYLATVFEVTLDDDNLEMDAQHSKLEVFEPPYGNLHPYVERYLLALE
ncbi:GDP-mannose mannosyl hydrolase [Haloferax sulfurifontis]|uniref:GDP-mannose mannosyl hydrolase NudD n=1 Tax=Haloferax sulfurifontis TaxID=255616 RepID=A0A830DSW4_9EURY|nr:NUDIX domain-containing protein [Haloferax sulfurifontis]GGC48592.1 GDP-mannose mannosyl hydrolase NudD [Haloferax sulfurifontis]